MCNSYVKRCDRELQVWLGVLLRHAGRHGPITLFRAFADVTGYCRTTVPIHSSKVADPMSMIPLGALCGALTC
jgi:hypothetical protein